ncbi:C-type lectin 37Da-like [Drosophila takahashii]|uniref:C-type lectin 37Da-like n=1 Tax=Drosophila takahashii TaxID=29030 RepID=UPI001CF87ED5|nr:C-type lectin 37Da-like [Drosophila takahashii]
MFQKLTGLCVLLGALSLCAAYKITPNIIDGVPGFLNITTAPFVKIGSDYYLIVREDVNWYAAYESCRQKDAFLISFDDLEELNLIAQYLVDTDADVSYWTSGADLAEQDKHKWFSNGRALSSDLWLPGEPNNSGNVERCVEFGIRLEVPGLNDRNCIRLNSYICKAPQPKTASFIVW